MVTTYANVTLYVLLRFLPPELVALKYACATIGVITCNLNFLDADHFTNGRRVIPDEITLIKPKMLSTLDTLEDYESSQSIW